MSGTARSMPILFGTIAVTQAFLPLLRAAPAARIVNLSSLLGSLALRADRHRASITRKPRPTTPQRPPSTPGRSVSQ